MLIYNAERTGADSKMVYSRSWTYFFKEEAQVTNIYIIALNFGNSLRYTAFSYNFYRSICVHKINALQ